MGKMVNGKKNWMVPSTFFGYEHRVVERGSIFFVADSGSSIAFARTIATDRKYLVFDEATATNIDTETEEEIQAALAKMRKGATIAIAHRDLIGLLVYLLL